MTITGNYDKARPSRKSVTILTGDVFGRTDIIAGEKRVDGDPAHADAAACPHAFLVEQLPNVSLPPHFHLTDQFQVVLAGGGMLGRNHHLAPQTVHFSRAKTGYGPIVSGDEGLAYLTLRPRLEYGAHYLADPKTQVDRRAPKFQATGSPRTPDTGISASACDDDDSRGTAAPAWNALIALNSDGLAVWQCRLGAGVLAPAPPSANRAGRFHVIAEGSARVSAEHLPRWSCIWAGPRDDHPHIEAGPDGAVLLTLQFPDYSLDLPALPDRAALPT